MLIPGHVKEIIQNAPEEAKPYLESHSSVKIRLTLTFSRSMRKAFAIEGGNNSDVVALASTVIFNNIDEIIDDGFITCSEEKAQIIAHFQRLAAGGTPKMPLENQAVDPLKFKELEYLCLLVRERVKGTVGEAMHLDSMDQIAAVAKVQIDQRFENLPLPSTPILRSLISEIDSFINQWDFEKGLTDRLQVAARLGAFSGALMTPISEIKPEEVQTLRALLFFGAAFQLYDDLCDLHDDIAKGQETAATYGFKNNFPEKNLESIRKISDALFQKSFEEIREEQKMALRFFSIIFTIFTKLNSSRGLRKVFNSSKRLGTIDPAAPQNNQTKTPQ